MLAIPLLAIVFYIYSVEIKKARRSGNWDAVPTGGKRPFHRRADLPPPEFAAAVRRKLVLEIAGLPPRVIPAATSGALPGGGYDCEIGEKMWEEMQRLWFTP